MVPVLLGVVILWFGVHTSYLGTWSVRDGYNTRISNQGPIPRAHGFDLGVWSFQGTRSTIHPAFGANAVVICC